MKRHKKWWISGLLVGTIIIGVLGFQSALSDKEEKVVALGDSLTFGVGDGTGNGYVENLKQWLERHHDGDTTVDNYAIPGQQSDGLLGQMNEAVVLKSIENADYILLFIGTNDLIKSNGGDLAPLNKEQIARGKKDYQANIKEILDTIRKENPDAPVLFLGLYNPYPDQPEINKVITDWNDTSKELLQSYEHITFIKTNDLFQEKSTHYFSDEIHLNEEGYERLTKRIIKAYDFQ
ncbi:Lysophospholipase L1 [Halobacillus dabanensis]|uniref:Lysophospholipase L1 n=1 Tax=Halobacillus dabanensis TaxID=240302 RepID=A0A1I3Q651_HALDA|nr:GDSL-type esterase/lipase family protein [Halobacillus dabanensis]SFJ28887.1 Lysophospholipase L1 [Halobacillus dabanensis]